MDIKNIFLKNNINKNITVKGWIKNFRNNKFIIINDGTYYKNIQIVFNKNKYNKLILKYLTIGTSLKVKGVLLYRYNILEIKLKNILIYHNNLKKNIQKSLLQKKNHSITFIRKQRFLRFQTNIYTNILRIKNYVKYIIYKYLYKKNFIYIQTPIITNINPESILEVFILKNNFFKNEKYLTVSGQLENEISINGIKKVFSFGPVFRAEKSITNKHLAEFWMLEIEIAFCNLKKLIIFIKKFLKYLITKIILKCKNDLSVIDKFNKKDKNYSFNKILNILNNIKIITYKKIIKILKKKYNTINYGINITNKYEKYLSEYFNNNTILIIKNYPKNIKAFYMKLNENNKTVKSIDILFPYIGEIIGGSERENNFDILLKNIKKHRISKKLMSNYLKTRIYGNTPHSGFGFGFDRFIQFITNINNIKDIVDFPIYYKK
ncbi:MAG: asparagine--tRNA ligase [Candidatus Shikimatogenerans sp. Tduv]|uniref:Asparagine--tRNA ligase n=1 Tax=Candidatus Shikimatogenerans sp. Tduv TaxID=3158567 RepID=A0AAU7QRB6_9FLAO